jgi:small basic protein
MWFGIIGLIIGIVVGIFAPITIPLELARYTAVGILGILDSILGAVRSDLQNKYDVTIFISGLFFNMVLAILITYIGDRLGLDLYLAVLVVFTIRIFANISTIRYSFLTKYIGKKRVEQEIKEHDNLK